MKKGVFGPPALLPHRNHIHPNPLMKVTAEVFKLLEV